MNESIYKKGDVSTTNICAFIKLINFLFRTINPISKHNCYQLDRCLIDPLGLHNSREQHNLVDGQRNDVKVCMNLLTVFSFRQM